MKASPGSQIYLHDDIHTNGKRFLDVPDPVDAGDADNRQSRDAAIAAAFAPGLTQDVTVAGVTLHFVNGLLTGVS